MITIEICCSRCGQDHFAEFHKLQSPIQMGDYVVSRWALCESTNEPILMFKRIEPPTASSPESIAVALAPSR